LQKYTCKTETATERDSQINNEFTPMLTTENSEKNDVDDEDAVDVDNNNNNNNNNNNKRRWRGSGISWTICKSLT